MITLPPLPAAWYAHPMAAGSWFCWGCGEAARTPRGPRVNTLQPATRRHRNGCPNHPVARAERERPRR